MTLRSSDCIYHRKHKKQSKPVGLIAQSVISPDDEPECIEVPVNVSPSGSSQSSQIEPTRNHAADWKSKSRIDWGLPNHLLGYNKTTKQRFDGEVELKRRNVELMDSFAAVNESVAKLLALLSMETAPGLPQVPDRSKCGGKPFTIRNYIDLKCTQNDNH